MTPPPRRAPTRFSWAGVAVLAGAGLVAVIVTAGIFLPALGSLLGGASRDPANLPDRISVCGRQWTKAAQANALSTAEVFARDDREPIVVEVALAPPCPPEVLAPGGDADGMATVVYVRTGDDAFVPYSLVGGP